MHLKPKDSWDSLSVYEKSDLIDYALQNGVYDLGTIRKAYNEYAGGGSMADSNIQQQQIPPTDSRLVQQVLDIEKAYNKWKAESTYATGGNLYDGGGYKWTRVRSGNRYGYVKTNSQDKPVEFNSSTGLFKVYDSPDENSRFFETSKKTGVDSDGLKNTWLDEITVTPQGMQIQDSPYDANALFKAAQQAERNKEITRNKAIDAKVSQYAFTPEGFFGQAMQPMNLLSPTHVGRSIYNISTDSGYGDFWKDIFMHNNGVFSDEFAKEHPYWTMAGNMLTDALAFGTGTALRNMPKYRAAMQAEDRALQEAVANQWDDMISRGVRPDGSEYIPLGYNQYYVSQIPVDINYAYRIMEPAEVEDLAAGNELRSYKTNPAAMELKEQQRIAAAEVTKTGKINLFKAGAEHGGRKQFSKGEPWGGTTVTNGTINYLAIPGKDLPWVGGRHYPGMRGKSVNFEETPIGRHIDLTTQNGFSGVNPSQMKGAYFYLPYENGFVRKPVNPTLGEIGWDDANEYIQLPQGLRTNTPLVARGTPKITAENAANITPEQWTAAQDAAIARGDIAEAQRLRDLHFKVSAPNTKVVTEEGMPLSVEHGTVGNKYIKPFYEFSLEKAKPGVYGKGFYFSRQVKPDYNKGRVIKSYLNMENPQTDIVGTPLNDGIMDDIGAYFVARKPNQIKLSDAVTYDKGVRIPLGKRDNFNINDIRYSWLPWLLGGGTAATMYGSGQK